jgi:antirestriction protein ArdC
MKRKANAKRADVYTRITDKIVAALEQGTRPWIRPWNAEHAAGRITKPLRHNGVPYQGINIVMLWQAAMACDYANPIWMTYRQASELGGQVRKGEKGELVVYANKVTRTEQDADGNDKDVQIPFLKGFTVFNCAQIDGLPAHYYQLAEPVHDPVERIDHAESYFAATGAHLTHGGNRAYYSVTHDRIQMPPFETFRDAESYYATLAHECTHWTRHSSRLEREFGRKRWGDEGYAREELVAELGSAFVCADLELALEPREDHAAYIESWLKVLKNDKRAIFSAAAHAQRAADFLNSLQPQAQTEAAA